MAITLTAKPVGAIHMYSWKPDLAEGDGIASYVLTPTTIGIESDQSTSDGIEFFVSGGAAGNVYPIAVTVDTSFGETLKETLYIPVYGPGNAFSATAGDVVDYALRPIVGIGETAEDNEKADALEWLNGMIAFWRDQGADIGVSLPIILTDTLYVPDAYILAVKNNLRVLVAEQYGRQVAPTTAIMAQRGLQQIKQALLPDDREPAEYY